VLDVLNKEHMRPSWDTYFIRLAELAATRSNCMQYHSGCVVVNGQAVVSTGYNGTPVNTVNCCQGGCDACNRFQDSPEECMCLHSETSALLEAGRPLTEGSTMYSTSFPCVQCAKNLVQAGIVRLVFSRANSLQSLAATLLENAGLQVECHAATIQAEDERY
jgi:dCMP deaminase